MSFFSRLFQKGEMPPAEPVNPSSSQESPHDMPPPPPERPPQRPPVAPPPQAAPAQPRVAAPQPAPQPVGSVRKTANAPATGPSQPHRTVPLSPAPPPPPLTPANRGSPVHAAKSGGGPTHSPAGGGPPALPPSHSMQAAQAARTSSSPPGPSTTKKLPFPKTEPRNALSPGPNNAFAAEREVVPPLPAQGAEATQPRLAPLPPAAARSVDAAPAGPPQPPPVVQQSEPSASAGGSLPTTPDTVGGRSARPAAAWDLQAAPEAQSIADTFAALLNDVDASFGSLQMKKGDSQRPGGAGGGSLSAVGLSDVRELFEQLAANHMRQVRDFMIDVTWGEAARDWASVCESPLRSLRRAAEKLDLVELCDALDDYRAALEAAGLSKDRILGGEDRDLLVHCYAKLLELMPHAFALESDRTQREAVIVQALLLQVPEVRKVTIDKLYAAGLSSLEVMFAARADEIAATTGIPLRLAERIVEKVQVYRKEIASVVPDTARSIERERLGSLVRELKRQHAEYERAAAAWTEEASTKKRYLRQARDETLLRVKVLLARLGEVERLSSIDRLPFQKKIESIEAFLEEAVEKYV
jgi:hypothetical protein